MQFILFIMAYEMIFKTAPSILSLLFLFWMTENQYKKKTIITTKLPVPVSDITIMEPEFCKMVLEESLGGMDKVIWALIIKGK